ncbi:TRAP transporter TAXI family solute receptor [Evansella vedderi]|uniref:TRAP transporter TAXI family solute receptor n=1 Tax=Evansella vedderi TaxID=38282 RepID=A0ABT9ZRQ7_9BACI|nr:TAXI family TRAP transporter solute-binding subunit [Evansella vedderi]MDQ0252850.1 TRAP transporter TAXI family solute receptor [Evansella vedderi]
MKKFGFLLGVLFAFAMVLAACGSDESTGGGDDWVSDVTILTGGEAGVYFPLGVAMGDIIDANVDGVSASGIVSGASLVNVAELNKGEGEMALVQNDIAYFAIEGTQMFEEDGPLSGFQGVATLYPETVQIVTTADTGIETVADLVGKRVAIGDVGSGTEANANQILAAHGISYDDITVEYMGFGDASTALQDGNIDAAFVTAGTPTGSIQQLGATVDVRIVSIEQSVIDEIVSQYPYYTGVTISADTYDLPTDVTTVAVQAMLIVRSDLPEDQVYEMTKAIFENLNVLQDTHDRGHDITVETAQDGMSIELHPGAKRFYDEQ